MPARIRMRIYLVRAGDGVVCTDYGGSGLEPHVLRYVCMFNRCTDMSLGIAHGQNRVVWIVLAPIAPLHLETGILSYMVRAM